MNDTLELNYSFKQAFELRNNVCPWKPPFYTHLCKLRLSRISFRFWWRARGVLVQVYIPLYWLGGGQFLFQRTPAFWGKSSCNTSLFVSWLQPGSNFETRWPEQVGIFRLIRFNHKHKMKIVVDTFETLEKPWSIDKPNFKVLLKCFFFSQQQTLFTGIFFLSAHES